MQMIRTFAIFYGTLSDINFRAFMCATFASDLTLTTAILSSKCQGRKSCLSSLTSIETAIGLSGRLPCECQVSCQAPREWFGQTFIA